MRLKRARRRVLMLLTLLFSTSAVAQTPIPPSAQDFATAATQSDQYEIEAAHVALTQSQNSQIKAFAQQMLRDHTRTSDGLRKAAMASHLDPPPPAMSSDQAAMLSALQSVRGADFDKVYVKQQFLAHTQALAVEQSYAQAGSDTNLRKAAQSAITIIQHHLMVVQQIKSQVVGIK